MEGSWKSIRKSWSSPAGLLEGSWKYLGSLNESLCCFAISVDEPEVRRVGFARFDILPPSRAIAPLLLWGRGSSGSGGGLCAMLEKPKFVPMARPYAFHIPIFIHLPIRVGFASSAPDYGKGKGNDASHECNEGSYEVGQRRAQRRVSVL